MDFQQLFPYIVAPLILAMGSFLFNSIWKRLDALEARVQTAMTEAAVRQVINDKIDPLREDIIEIKQKLNQLLDSYLKDHKSQCQ